MRHEGCHALSCIDDDWRKPLFRSHVRRPSSETCGSVTSIPALLQEDSYKLNSRSTPDCASPTIRLVDVARCIRRATFSPWLRPIFGHSRETETSPRAQARCRTLVDCGDS